MLFARRAERFPRDGAARAIGGRGEPPAMAQRILMCPPDHFVVRDVKNPFMRSGMAVDSQQAALQWNAVKAAFEDAGAQVLTIAPVDDLEDMVFAANQAFAGSGIAHARFAVPSSMRYPSRRREVPYFTDWFRSNGFAIVDLGLDPAAEEFLEGHGDLVAHPERAQTWAGFGFRSSRSGVDKFARAVKAEGLNVTPLELIDETFYHLDTCFAPLNAEAALVYAPAFSPSSLETLRRHWRLYEVARADAERFACNGLALNGRFIASHVSEEIDATVRREGLQPVVVDTSEFEKAGGSIFCLKTILD
jgi:N-dimethylarginine dimethylaminohydrolase